MERRILLSVLCTAWNIQYMHLNVSQEASLDQMKNVKLILVSLNCPCSLPDRWRSAMGFASGEKGRKDHCAWWQAKPWVPAHPGPAWVQIRSLQDCTGRRQSCHPGEQGLCGKRQYSGSVSNLFEFKLVDCLFLSLPGGSCPVSGRYRCFEDGCRVSQAFLQWKQQHQNTCLCVCTYLGYNHENTQINNDVAQSGNEHSRK